MTTRRHEPPEPLSDPARAALADGLASAERGEIAPMGDFTKHAKKRTQTDATRAAILCNKLDAIDADEQAELAASPSEIRAKFERRRLAAMGEVTEVVRGLVERMRAK